MAFDPQRLDTALKEKVTRVSLLRSVRRATVQGQYARLAQGGARLSRYNFSYSGPRKARSPEGFRQTPEFVASRVVACLRKPRGEVWTSTPARLLAALGTAWPSLADHILSKRFEPWQG